MRFHLWTVADDEHGITPTAFALHKHGARDRDTHAVAAETLKNAGQPLRLEQDTFMQGPPRHPDRVQWIGDGAPHGAYFIVSRRIHRILEGAALPEHDVVDIEIQFAKKYHKKFGANPEPYFLHAFAPTALIDIFDLDRTELSCTVRLLSERARFDHRLPPGAVIDASAAWAATTARCPAGQRPWLIPAALQAPINAQFKPEIDFSSPHFPLHIQELDLIFLDHTSDPWISDGLRDALLDVGATGMAFQTSWDASRLAPPTDARQIEQRQARAAGLRATAALLRTAPTIDPGFSKALARRADILSRNDRVRAAQATSPAPTDDAEAAMCALEARLDVLLPSTYRQSLRAGTLPRRGRFRFFAEHELRTLEQIDPDWTKRSCPDAVRALLVASDAGGDYLGYLLRSDSSIQLDDKLMHFKHETAEVVRSRVKAS